jgi:hypothetical protein
MTIALGTECYNVDSGTVVARGHSYLPEELQAALDGPVSATIRDDAGHAAVADLLHGLAETGFEHENVERILTHHDPPEGWRVGEAIAECYLTDHRICTFPWPAGRDQRNPDSSPTGADLVGFHHTGSHGSPCRFAFGEVKTSSENRFPPSTMYGRNGMVQQLETLRDDELSKYHLVTYLAHRAPGKTWQPQFEHSAKAYLIDSTDVSLFGVLVRDVSPNSLDLHTRAETLAEGCPSHTSIELFAIYLPNGSIPALGKRVILSKEGSHVSN